MCLRGISSPLAPPLEKKMHKLVDIAASADLYWRVPVAPVEIKARWRSVVACA